MTRRITRRVLLRDLGATAALTAASGVALGAPAFLRGRPGDPQASDLFPLGVGSGNPTPNSVVLWTRLAPDPLNGGGMSQRPVP